MAKSSHRTNSGYGWTTVSLSRPESLIYLTKIISNSQPAAAHAVPRTSQKKRSVNRYLLSLSFMAGAKLEVMALFRQSRR